MVDFYATPDREPSQVLGQAFSQGCGGRFLESRIFQGNDAAFYGRSKYTSVVQTACTARGHNYYYMDNGYFNPGHYDGYYRVTKNAEQYDGISGEYDPDRALGLQIDPWRKRGSHILIVTQSKTYFELRGMRHGNWLWETIAALARVTDRQFIVRSKPTIHTKKRCIQKDLADAWAVVTYSSNAAVEAIMQGIPAVTLGQCVATPLSTELENIETPNYPDREEWAMKVASNQWTLNEIRDGVCWDAVQ